MNTKAMLELKTVLMNSLSRRYFNSNIAAVTKVHRETYTRTYPTTVVLADGSSINIRYHEPRKIIKVCTTIVATQSMFLCIVFTYVNS